MNRQFRTLALSPFVRRRLTMFIATQRAADLETLCQLAETGRLSPAIGTTYPLSEAPEALRHLESGQARGKTAITV